MLESNGLCRDWYDNRTISCKNLFVQVKLFHYLKLCFTHFVLRSAFSVPFKVVWVLIQVMKQQTAKSIVT